MKRMKFPVALLSLLSVAAWVFIGRQPVQSNGFEVAPRSQKLLAGDGNQKILAFYRVKNLSRKDLVFGEISTTCGCSVAAISPKTLKSGATAVISVTGTPPVSGEKPVRVTVKTNLIEAPDVVMDLVMVGNTPLPYILSSTAPVQFGEIYKKVTPQSLIIRTAENLRESPWLSAPSGSTSGLSVVGGLTGQKELGSVAYREYAYTVNFTQRPVPGNFIGRIVFNNPESSKSHEESVLATFRPSVFPVPLTLYASVMPNEAVPELTVTLKSTDPDLNLLVSPPDSSSLPFNVRRISGDHGRIMFGVSFKSGPVYDLQEVLVFGTNHPETPEVRVPITVKCTTH